MGNIRDEKSQTAIETAIETVISETDATQDLTEGTVVKDIVVDAPATQFRDLYVLTDFVASLSNLSALLVILEDDSYLDDLETALPELTTTQIQAVIKSYIDGLASNYGITRTVARQAQYRQRFYRTDNNGGATVSIPVGTQVQNADGSIRAIVQVSTPQVPVLDSVGGSGLYYVEETVVAVTTGSGGNTALNSLNRFVSAIPALATRTGNITLLVAGRDEENNADLVDRIRDSFRGRNINTVTGYSNILRADPLAFSDTKVVGPGNALMTRLATGGIDIYGIGSEPATISERQSYSSVQDMYLLSYQPVDSLLSVVGSVSGTINPAAYELTTDTSAFAESARGRKAMSVLDPTAFTNGEILTLTYTYDALIGAAQNQIESEDYDVPDADVLVKRATQVGLNLTLEIIYTNTVAQATVRANLEADFAVFLAGGTTSRGIVRGAYDLGEDVDKSDILLVLGAVAGVDRIDLDTFVVKTVRGGVATTASTDPVPMDDNEYARAGTITYV